MGRWLIRELVARTVEPSEIGPSVIGPSAFEPSEIGSSAFEPSEIGPSAPDASYKGFWKPVFSLLSFRSICFSSATIPRMFAPSCKKVATPAMAII